MTPIKEREPVVVGEGAPLADAVRKRIANRARILEALHFHGPLRRTEISRHCQVRKSSVTSILEELLDLGLVVEASPGRARSPLKLDGRRWHVIASDVSGGAVRVARVFLDGHTEDAASVALNPDALPDEILEALAREMQSRLTGRGDDVLGVGAAMPGLVDTRDGTGLHAVNLRQWRDVPIRAALERALNGPVLVENEIRCGLWASLWFERMLLAHRDILYLVLSDGVGGALFVHDMMIRGSHFAAGEFGHVRVGDEKRLCACGKVDCLEAYASLPAMLKEIHALCPDVAHVADGADIARVAPEQPIVRNILDRAMARLAWVASSVTASFDPSLILLGGQPRPFCELILPMLEKHLRVELGATFGDVALRAAAPGRDATLQGAAGLVTQRAFRRLELVWAREAAAASRET